MELYIVEKPVIARSEPTPSSPVVNAYSKGTKINILGLDSGWYMTESGNYILKTKDIKPYSQWLREHREEIGLKIEDGGILPNILKMKFKKVGGDAEVNDSVTITGKEIKDVNTGNLLPSDIGGKKLVVTKVDGSNVTVKDGDKQYTIPASALKVEDTKSTNNNVSNSVYTPEEQKGIVQNVVDQVNNIFKSTGLYGLDQLDIKIIRTIYGAPYQFTPITDPRYDGSFNNSSLGRLYTHKIAARAPILVMQPGVPDFLRGFDKDTEDKVSAAVAKGMSFLGSDTIEQMINQPGMYYGFKAKIGQYYNAVNAMCRAMALFLGIEDYEWTIGDGNGSYIGDEKYSWELNSTAKYFGYNAGSVCFYINAEPQINESFNNGTTKSMLDQSINQIGKMGSELQFLLGGAAGWTGWDLTSDNIQKAGETEYNKRGTSGAGGLIDSIIDNVQTVLAGGRMIFPEIWADSQVMRTYSVTIKLVSPDADNLSVFLNIFVPLAHILAFVLPRSLGNNNYISPFLVRAFYRSMFHVDMGIVTDCQIQRGDNMAWSQMGVPLQITVQLQIKDLYSVMSMALGGEFPGNKITSNPFQLDYIANLCGINIDEPDLFGKTLKLWWAYNNPMSAIPSFMRLQTTALQSSLFQTMQGIISNNIFHYRY